MADAVVSTAVLPPDLKYSPTFPAEPAFRAPGPEQDVHFRHSGWLADRRRTYDAIMAVFPGSTRLERFRVCGTNAWVIRNEDDPGSYAVVSDHCRDRFCRPCSAFRGRVIAHNVSAYIDTRPYRFLTMTIKTTDLTLKQGVDKLCRSFAAIRQTKLWKSKVLGGCSMLEVKPKAGGTGWHPHVHAIIQGKYLPLKPLRKLWMKITHDSFIVDISFGRDADAAAAYVTKYVTKPFSSEVTRNPGRLQEAIRALHGRRLVATFGSWRGLRITEYHPSGVWVKVCPLGVLRNKALAGDDEAMALMEFLVRSKPYREVPTPNPRPPPGNGGNGNSVGPAAGGEYAAGSGRAPRAAHHPPPGQPDAAPARARAPAAPAAGFAPPRPVPNGRTARGGGTGRKKEQR